jgi:diguanylate cyclase (GGDEF)-like protein
MEFQDALNAIVLAAHKLIPVDRVAVFLRDPSSDEFYPTLPHSNSPLNLRLNEEQALEFSTLRMKIDQLPLLQEMQHTHKPIVINEVIGDPIFPSELSQIFDIRSLMISPIIIQNKLEGALYVDNTGECHNFTREEIDLIVGLSRQASLALERAQLFKSAKKRALELDTLHAATTSLLSTIDLVSLLNQIIEGAKRAIPSAEMGTLRLKNPGSEKLEVRAIVDFPNPQPQEAYLKIEENFAASVIQDQNPLLIPNVNHNQSNFESEKTNGFPEIQSAIVAPLLYDQEATGALSLLAKEPDAFSEDDLRLLVSFAATASAAIRNAQLHAEIQALAITDSLTEVFNRRGLIELGTREVERAHRFNRPLTAIFIDLDHFKRVNDRFGHPIGDQVLRAIIHRCGKYIREIDILGRYGGEEFVILLPEVNTNSGAKIAERLRQEVANKPIKTDVGKIAMTISLGVAEITSDIRNIYTLIEQADAVMYNAKKSGRNRVAVLHEVV